MADKELRHLSRADLIEIIYEVRKNEAALQKENEELKRQLKDRRRRMEKAGNLAELAAAVNSLFESAQATADDYLADIREAHERSEQLRRDVEQKAARAAEQTARECRRMIARTEAQCRQMTARTARQGQSRGSEDEEPDEQDRAVTESPDAQTRAAKEGPDDE